MVEESIPPPTEDLTLAHDAVSELERRIARLELEGDSARLSDESTHRGLLISEVRQRIRMRYTAFGLAVVTMIFMGVTVWHTVHSYFWGSLITVPQSVAIVMFLAPITSITAITIVVLIGAFRRFRDDDMDNVNVTSLAGEAVKAAFPGGR